MIDVGSDKEMCWRKICIDLLLNNTAEAAVPSGATHDC